MLGCVKVWYAVPCCAALLCTTGMLCSAMLWSAARWLYCAVLSCEVLCCTVLRTGTMLHCAVLCHGTLQDLVNSFCRVWTDLGCLTDLLKCSWSIFFIMITSLSSIFTAELPAYDRYQKMRKGQKQQQQYYLSLKLDFSQRIIKAKPFNYQKKTTVIWKDICQRSTITQKTRYSVIHHPNWAKPF